MIAKKSILPLFAAAFLALLPAYAEAGIAVSPLKQEISLRPGEAGKVSITVSNIARDEQSPPQAMHIEITDVRVAQDGSLALPPVGTQTNSAGKWITLANTDLTLHPGKSQVLDFAVNPPQNAAPGEYYSSILVTLAAKGKTDKGLVIQFRLASAVFLTVQGRTLNRHGKIKSADFLFPKGPESLDTPLPETPAEEARPTLAVVLENTGNARFDGSGKLALFDKSNHLVFRTALTSNRPCIFAGDSRGFEAVLSKPLPAGKYLAKIAMDYQSGWSSAHLEMPLEVTAEQASAWARAASPGQEDGAVLEAGPAKISGTFRPGSSRSFAVTLRNVSEVPIHAALAPPIVKDGDPGAWLSISAEEFPIAKASRRAVEIRINIPADAAPGKYAFKVTLNGGPQGQPMQPQVAIPIELEVKAEKP